MASNVAYDLNNYLGTAHPASILHGCVTADDSWDRTAAYHQFFTAGCKDRVRAVPQVKAFIWRQRWSMWLVPPTTNQEPLFQD